MGASIKDVMMVGSKDKRIAELFGARIKNGWIVGNKDIGCFDGWEQNIGTLDGWEQG